jgi:vacuolar-type H+-ATPase subunit H
MPFVTVCTPVTNNTTSTTTGLYPIWHNSIIYATDNGTFSTGNIYNNALTNFPIWHDNIIYAPDNGTFSTSTQSTCFTGNFCNFPTWHSTVIEITEDQYVAIQAEVDRQNREREQQIQEARERARVREAGAAKAKEVLLDHLTSEQRETVEKNHWFVIEGGKSKKKYRIGTKAIAGNVEELDDKGKAIARYCCHLAYSYPPHDHHLTQKLMLEWDEEEFLKKANKTSVG